MRYVIRATHEDGRRFCHEIDGGNLRQTLSVFVDRVKLTHGAIPEQLTTIDIDRLDDEPANN